MYKKLLDQFFNENTVEGELPSVQGFAYYQIMFERNQELNKILQGIFNENFPKPQPGREENFQAEKNEIGSATSCEQIIRLMRRGIDNLNYRTITSKALEFEDEIIPEIMRRLKTSLNISFIELSIRILSKTSMDIADELIGYFDDVRDLYAKSMILVALGFLANETHISWLIEKYKELIKQYPDKSYCEGAYYALYEIDRKMHSSGQKHWDSIRDWQWCNKVFGP